MGAFVEANGLVVRRGRSVVLNDVSFTLPQGACAVVLGPNGAGKTTLLEAMLGLLPIEAGSVHIAGSLVRDGEGRRARRPPAPLGVLLQADGDLRDQTVRHHLEVAASLGGCLLDDGALEALLNRVGLRHRMADRMVELSVGQRRRVGLLAAVLPGLVDGGGRLLVLDEPTAGLDHDGIHLASELVNEAAARGCTVLLGTHHPERFSCATHSVTVDEGEIRVVDLPAPEVRSPCLTSLESSVVRPSSLRLGLRYAWSGGTPLSGSVPALLVTLGCAALLLQPAHVSDFDGTLRLGLLMLPALVVGLAGDASLTTLRRDRAFARLSALGCRPLDPFTPLALGCAGTVAMGAILGASPSLLAVMVAGGMAVTVSMLVRAGDVLGLRLARPEVLHLRLLSLLVVLPFGLLLDLMA